MAEEFDYFLHWDLPISTFVEFNEVGMSIFFQNNVSLPLSESIDREDLYSTDGQGKQPVSEMSWISKTRSRLLYHSLNASDGSPGGSQD